MTAQASPRSVLYVAWAPFFSGAERAMLLTLRSLDPARYVPHVLVGTDGEFATQVRDMGISCEIVSTRPVDRRRPLASLGALASTLRAALHHRAALIHSNEVPSFQIGGYIARVLGIPAVTHVRFPDTEAGYRWFLRPGFTRALFVSNGLRNEAVTAAPGLFDSSSDVLHDGVEMQPEWTPEQVGFARADLGLPHNRVIVAMAGQVAEVKGIWDFVEAARILATRGAEPFFAVLGDDLKTGGQIRRAMQEKVAALGLADRFAFLGFRRDAPRVVQAFDMVAVPSHVEPLGNATLEAMAAGRPVIGSRVGGIPEMIVDGETGMLIPPASPVDLADAIGALVRDSGTRGRMARAARHRAETAFSIPAHGARLQAHYDQLLQTRLAASARPEVTGA
ncbi:MAG: glycosyltransferase [Acidobacteria bacterium]|nr:glycosyltransferase [Acidobacteriota bacterium]